MRKRFEDFSYFLTLWFAWSVILLGVIGFGFQIIALFKK